MTELNKITNVFKYVNYFVRPLFKNKKYITLFLKAISEQFSKLTITLYDLYDKRWLNTATGVNLDIVGEIVNESRKAIAYDDNIFKFNIGKGFDEGELFFSNNQKSISSTSLDDEIYRLFIKAKILINRGHGTYKDIYNTIKILVGTSDIDIIDIYPRKVRVNLGSSVNESMKVFIMQKIEQALPIGIKLESLNFGSFYFDDDNSGVGFDEGILW